MPATTQSRHAMLQSQRAAMRLLAPHLSPGSVPAKQQVPRTCRGFARFDTGQVCSDSIDHLVISGTSTAKGNINVAHAHPALPLQRPFIVGHRAGNHLPMVARAARRGVDMLEADVWRYRTRLEVRHLKTLGPVPVLWDRWKLSPGWTPRLEIDALLDEAPDDMPIMFDLKGDDPNLSTALVDAVHGHKTDRPIIMCTRMWVHLDRVRDQPAVHRIYSIGSVQERDQAWSRLEAMEHPAVSVHRELVTPSLMKRLEDIGATVISWGSTTMAHADLLLSLGVDGLTVAEGSLQNRLLRERQGKYSTATTMEKA